MGGRLAPGVTSRRSCRWQRKALRDGPGPVCGWRRLKWREERFMLCREAEIRGDPTPGRSPSPDNMKARQQESTRTGSVLGGFSLGLGVAGLYFALQLWILPAAGIPT